MNIQTLLAAVADCRKVIEAGCVGPGPANRGVILRGAFGLQVIETLMSEPECEVNVISFGFGEMEPKADHPFKTMLEKLCEEMQAHKAGCPRCHNEEIGPKDKFCKICGMALLADKGEE